MLKKLILSVLIITVFIQPCFAEKKQIAITIDDLPFVGDHQSAHLDMITDAIVANEIPVTGFVIAQHVSTATWESLRKFRDAGLGIGNHTLSHVSLNKVGADAYVQEIDDADKILLPLLTEPKFFRYPYLAVGKGEKKEKIQQFLQFKNYHIAPVTIDTKDFTFNQLLLAVPEKDRRDFLALLKPCYLSFIWEQTIKADGLNIHNHKKNQPHILLIHANLLNAYLLPDIIKLYKQHGYNFVRLEDALNIPEEKLFSENQPKYNAYKEDGYMAWD